MTLPETPELGRPTDENDVSHLKRWYTGILVWFLHRRRERVSFLLNMNLSTQGYRTE